MFLEGPRLFYSGFLVVARASSVEYSVAVTGSVLNVTVSNRIPCVLASSSRSLYACSSVVVRSPRIFAPLGSSATASSGSGSWHPIALQ